MINKKTSIGGQALIEGIMMMGPNKIATAVRKPDGEIAVRVRQIKKSGWLKVPFIRGSVALFGAMVTGVKELMYSAELQDDYEEDAFDRFVRKIFKAKAEKAIVYFSVVVALVLSISLFIITPSIVTSLLKNIITSSVLLNLVEGVLRIVLFTVYIYYISKIDDIKRVFMYHGAEHKTIFCYEKGEELTVENVRKYSTLHPRCGTSFIANVFIISTVVFSFFGWPNPLLRIGIRLAMLPVIAGIAYEVNRYVGKNCEKTIAKILSKPGFVFQKITTGEPEDAMIEIAITAMKKVIPENESEDNW